MEDFLLNFFQRRLHKNIIYAHNLTSFDGVFILKSLLKLGEKYDFSIQPIFRDGKLILIKCRFGLDKNNKHKYYIKFHDSMLLLLSSLDKLSKTFLKDKPSVQKLNNQILIDLLLYENIRKNHSNLSSLIEIEIYCRRDSYALVNVINVLSYLIFEKYKLNVHSYPTLPSLALAIYRSFYIKDFKIPKIAGDIYKDIKLSYTGGHFDVYNLYSNKECRLYDIVSLYPSVMMDNKYPVGLVNKFIGNPYNSGLTLNDLYSDNILLFIKCDIYVDKSIDRPVYQTHLTLPESNITRTISATGYFKDQWIFLPELIEYQNLTNNKIRIIENSIKEGYIFEAGNIFESYITELFKIKQSVSKTNPWYPISKILMNSLYGRFGLKNTLQEFNLLDINEIETFLSLKNIDCSDILEIDGTNKIFLILNKIVHDLNSSLPIASAVTAYARMRLAPILLDESIKVLYTDTDSYVIEGDLELLNNGKYKSLLHNNIGGLKLEHIFSEFIALAPKLYGGILEDNTEFKTKVKGFKDRVEFDILKNLLFNQDRNFLLEHNKWFRSLNNGEIIIKSCPYTLELNENKRRLDLTNLRTLPYHLNKG